MRYSIMLQIVGIITLILVGTAALFAWLQNRSIPTETESQINSKNFSIPDKLSIYYQVSR